jgi:hypothetical protein
MCPADIVNDCKMGVAMAVKMFGITMQKAGITSIATK